MKLKAIKNKDERTILTQMIVSRSVLARVTSKWGRHGNLFRSSWANMIGQWCVEHYRKYETTPKHNITERFQKWADKSEDKETVSLVSDFLGSLSAEYKRAKKSNSQFYIDMASDYFNKVKLERFKEELEELLEAGRVDKALELHQEFAKVEMGSGTTIDVLEAKDAVRQAFEDSAEPVVKYPGRIGQFLNPYLVRDSFIAFQAPEKGGKSYWMLDVLIRALEQRRKVAYFVLGDMSEGQVIKRIGCRLAGIPLDRKDLTIQIPVKLKRGPQESKVSFKSKSFKQQLTWRKAYRAFRKFKKSHIRSMDSYLKMQVHGPDELSVEGINEQMKAWETEGFVADVVVVDYADNLDMTGYNTDEPRHQSHKAWKAMRRLAQNHHCLVVSATQSNAAAYAANEEGKLMSRKNFSEDKRKLGQVNGMLGINQFPGDSDMGITRLNWIVLREGHFSDKRTCHVAGCLAVGRPCILSE